MRIYTRQGDSGQTSQADGSRVSKNSPRTAAIGELDEVGAAIGWARQAIDDATLGAALLFVQQRIFNCTASLASSSEPEEKPSVTSEDVEFIETVIDRYSEDSGGWRGFVVSSGGEAATRLHLARTMARRAERHLVTLTAEESVSPAVLAFVNRLSDLLFVAAHAAAHDAGAEEDLWDPDADPPVL